MSSFWKFSVSTALAVSLSSAVWAENPSPEGALKLTPIQEGVDFDTPSGDDVKQCTVETEKSAAGSGWLVRNKNGQTLRRFLDTNRDNKVDLWCYYKNGIEVYRDIDSDANSKADQYRWLGTAGARWGIDANEDGLVETWKQISAEEVSAEVVAALADKDAERFKALLISEKERKLLGLGEERSEEIAKKSAAAAAQFTDAARNQTLVTKNTQWLHFAAARPGVVPAGTDGSVRDLMVYDNTAAIVETDGKHGQVAIGTLVQVGEAWRVIDLPDVAAQGQASVASGIFFAATVTARPETAAPGPAGGLTEKQQALIADLQKVDDALSQAAQSAKGKLYAQRAETMLQLAASFTGEDRANWIRQVADSAGEGIQLGVFTGGVKMLENLADELGKNPADMNLAAYVKFRHLSAQYGIELQDPQADYAKIQENWLKNLADFVKSFPQSQDAAEAMLQLAIAEEFAGKEADAKRWYGRIASEFPQAEVAKKAVGAARRIDSVGKSIELRGVSLNGKEIDLAAYRGKTVLIHYWATWCEPCKEELKTLRSLQAKYGRRGFELIGISLDSDKGEIVNYLRQNPLSWHTLYEEGGLDSRFASELGILTLPTMILVDKNGRVVNRSIHAAELDGELEKLMK